MHVFWFILDSVGKKWSDVKYRNWLKKAETWINFCQLERLTVSYLEVRKFWHTIPVSLPLPPHVSTHGVYGDALAGFLEKVFYQ